MPAVTPEMVEKARAKFEKWLGEPLFGDLRRDSTGMYYSREARRGWESWEEAWRSAVQDAVRDLSPYLYDDDNCPAYFESEPCTCGLAALREKYGVKP